MSTHAREDAPGATAAISSGAPPSFVPNRVNPLKASAFRTIKAVHKNSDGPLSRLLATNLSSTFGRITQDFALPLLAIPGSQ
jgi:hypothetical protein